MDYHLAMKGTGAAEAPVGLGLTNKEPVAQKNEDGTFGYTVDKAGKSQRGRVNNCLSYLWG